MEALVDEPADLESHPTLNIKPVQLPMHEIGDGMTGMAVGVRA